MLGRVVLAILATASATHALEFCARKVNGTVHVREACRPTELRIVPQLAGLAFAGGRAARDVTSPLNVAALHALDAADQDIGLLVSITGNEYTVALESGVLVSIDAENDPPQVKVGGASFVGWLGADCAGTPYVEAQHVISQGLIHGPFYIAPGAPNSFYRIPPGAVAATVQFASRRDFTTTGAPCGAVSSAVSAFVLEPVAVPFTLPLAWPLRAQATP